MKVIVKSPQKPFEIVEVPDENLLEAFYEMIGCRCIDMVRISKDVQMICDDEYLVNESVPNLKYRNPQIGHIICGTVVFAGINGGGETIGFRNPDRVQMHLEILFHSFTEEEARKVNPGERSGDAFAGYQRLGETDWSSRRPLD